MCSSDLCQTGAEKLGGPQPKLRWPNGRRNRKPEPVRIVWPKHKCPIQVGRFKLNLDESNFSTKQRGFTFVVLDEIESDEVIGHIRQHFVSPIPLQDITKLVNALNSGKLTRWDMSK